MKESFVGILSLITFLPYTAIAQNYLYFPDNYGHDLDILVVFALIILAWRLIAHKKIKKLLEQTKSIDNTSKRTWVWKERVDKILNKNKKLIRKIDFISINILVPISFLFSIFKTLEDGKSIYYTIPNMVSFYILIFDGIWAIYLLFSIYVLIPIILIEKLGRALFIFQKNGNVSKGKIKLKKTSTQLIEWIKDGFRQP